MKPTSQLISRTHLLAAAGLWHDLGKVGEPADAKLDSHVANLDQTLCPTGPDGHYTHRHVLYTAQLFETAVSSGCTFGGLCQEALFRIAASHHVTLPGSLDEAILKKADWLASGHDRRRADVEDPRALVIMGLRPITASLSLPRKSVRYHFPRDSRMGRKKHLSGSRDHPSGIRSSLYRAVEHFTAAHSYLSFGSRGICRTASGPLLSRVACHTSQPASGATSRCSALRP